MALWTRVANVFRGDRVNEEIAEEFEFHLAEAIEHGRDPAEVRRAFGGVARQQEASHQVRVVGWLESLLADTKFGWRQMKRNKVTSLVAILSLALAIGACFGAFQLIDAVLWRPLPVAHADRLYGLARESTGFDGKPNSYDSWAYPAFERMRAAVKDQAELIAVSYAQRADVTYGSDTDMEKANVQYVSGWMFGAFELKPVLGRLLNEADDQVPGRDHYVVLSYDYWVQRFGRDPHVVGRTVRLADDLYEIIGVADKPFVGTEPGNVTEMFLPVMTSSFVTRKDVTWHRTLVMVKPGVPIEPLRQKLNAVSVGFETERARAYAGPDKRYFEQVVKEKLVMEPASAGVSSLQDNYGKALIALGVLVAMVLLIACANVANLMTAQASMRAREMALRVSLGAGRARLVQLVLIEGAMLAGFAAALGALFAWRSAPLVVSMINPPDNPAHLILPMDWRVLGFGLGLILCVILLFGLLPALRASAVKPVSALKGGDDPHSRRRLMHGMIAAQVAFCFLVVFVSGLFVRTFEKLSNQPLGFTPDRLLLLDVATRQAQPAVVWDQMAEKLRGAPGVENVAIANWALLDGNSWNGEISVNGAPIGPITAFFLSTSPGWTEAMKVPFRSGRDFRQNDTSPGQAVVNDTFVKAFFAGKDPIGKWFVKGTSRYEIIGVVGDVPYDHLKGGVLPVAYVPFHQLTSKGVPRLEGRETFLVRSSGKNPLELSTFLRKEIPRLRPDFRVSNLRTQNELVRIQTLRERLLALLAAFFAGVALLLAAIGLYGVLNYSVQQREREFGIRIAVGARVGDIAWLVTSQVLLMVLTGVIVGGALGMVSVRYVQTLLYGVEGNDPAMLVVPAMVLLAAALGAALPAVARAWRIDPAIMLRAE